MSGLYNRSALSPFTRANAEQVNAELTKIQAAIDALQGNIADIVAGTPIASYTWIAYSNSADGSDDFTTGDANGRLYIGVAYNRGSPIKSTDPTDYEWTRIRGEDGSDATSGADGLSIVEKYVYKRAVSAPTTPTGGSFNFSTQATTAPAGWSTGVPSGTDPVWVSVAVATKQGTGGSVGFGTWSTPALAFTNGTDGSDGADGAPGSSVDVIFRRSATQPAPPGAGLSTPAGWYTNVAAVPASSNPLFSSFGNRASPTSNWTWNTPVLVEGQPGLDGNDGIDGNDGKLIEFVWKRNPTQPAAPTGNGIPVGWSDDPPAGSDPLWMSKAKQELDGTLVVGETWSSPVRHDGPPGANGTNGTNGTNGLSNAVVYLYQRGATAPAAPSGTFTYTFTTGVLSGGTLNGWSQAIPAANGNPLWVIAATASAAATTDSIAAAEFTSPVLKDGAGLNGAPVFLYKRAASAPAVPASTLTYTFSTGLLSGTLSGWTQSVPANDGNPVYIITATALGTGTTDTIATGEWSTPQILAANGANGSDGAPGTSPVSAVASPASTQFTADADGVVKTGQLPFNVAVAGTKAGSSISGTVTILSVSGCTATAISGGFTIDTVSGDAGFVQWRFTASDSQVVEGKMSFSRQRDPASGGSVSINFTSTSWWGSGSYAASGPSTVLPASSTGKLRLGALASFYSASNGTATLTAKLQYRAVGSGTWIDTGFSSTSSAIKSPDLPGEPGENSPGQVGPGGTLTGLTPNGSYEVQMVGNRSTGGTAISSATGFVTLMQVT